MAEKSSSASDVFDSIVIGAGIQGSFTAYHLAKNGRKTLLLEQFLLPHSRGSSHGQTRIIRKAYTQDFYTKMMTECYQLWGEMETESNTKLCRQTGLMVIGDEQNPEFRIIWNTLGQNQVPREYLTPEEFRKRFPAVLLQPGEAVFYDHSAGVLYADKALRAVQDSFRRLGGAIRDGEMVTDIKPGAAVRVSTASGVYQGKSLVITAGPWASKLLNPLGLQLPLKICYHYGNEADPDVRDWPYRSPSIQDIQIISGFVRKYLPSLEPEPAIVERCMYTNTPDENFILDRHPDFNNIIVGAGFSGHGFKLAPVVGKLLSELAMGTEPSHNMEPFRITRFSNKLKSAL